jgi:hypothetical protein
MEKVTPLIKMTQRHDEICRELAHRKEAAGSDAVGVG